MTLAPRFLVNLWAAYRATRLARKLRTPGHDDAAQHAAFTGLMAQAAGTEFGRAHGLSADTTYAEFRDAVPPRTHDYFQPLVARMAAGEADVLVPGRCPFFVETAGATGLAPKLLPVPEAMLAHYRHGLRDALFLYAARTGHAGVFLGRQVHAGASTALREAHGTYVTGLDGMLALCLSPWVEANLYAPPPAVARLPEGAPKIAAIAAAMRRRDVTLVGGTPAMVAALAEAVRQPAGDPPSPPPQLPAVWPNLECFLHLGAPLGLFAEALRAALGPAVNYHEVYAAAEGIFAAQDDHPGPGLRLLTDGGVFYEFIPLADYQEAQLPSAGRHCLPLKKVQPGVDYVLLVTTPAGLARCVVGDIVRFTSVAPPRLQCIGRLGSYLNAFGEQVTERELLDTMLAVCARNGWHVVSFHVAPFQHRIAAGQGVRCHEWWLELHTHTTRTPTANVLGPELDAELATRNHDYAARRNERTIDSPQVRLVMPGVFEQWARQSGRTASLSKMPRGRSDRLIADQLAALARFHPATHAPFAPADRP
ncbi:GH3 auxin-responsive promoter family protein [Opitutus sp. GAS368]|uniref:GH3 family domain-containing protein n=1 Tax=Opitutus sp. GAS368 TaxID=1882749 RepID=UPI00087D3E5F|nr:GH3 auxin-responsive promoter family protein [Opitutus sp. GAS368]SDS07774.1 GH3 auxin-responsive promoter [Opitutus sp. GAS368]